MSNFTLSTSTSLPVTPSTSTWTHSFANTTITASPTSSLASEILVDTNTPVPGGAKTITSVAVVKGSATATGSGTTQATTTKTGAAAKTTVGVWMVALLGLSSLAVGYF